jgi:hypothetical protein
MFLYDSKKTTNPSSGINKVWTFCSPSMSYVKRRHLVASPVKLIFCGLPPFYKIGAKIVILAGQILFIQGKDTCRKPSVLLRAYFKM